MNFIEQLRQLGGVKPCVGCQTRSDRRTADPACPHCHGTDSILDLAPLLAKPKELEECVGDLAFRLGINNRIDGLYIIGPQHASNLVYEVARQLGGTAVVAHTRSTSRMLLMAHERGDMIGEEDMKVMLELERQGAPPTYFLSLPIPSDATVLFVTDRYDYAEQVQICNQIAAPAGEPARQTLPYLLALVSLSEKFGNWKVISLHQEKP